MRDCRYEGKGKSQKMFSKVTISVLLVLFTAFYSYGQNVTTGNATSVTSITATLTATVENPEGKQITEQGFKYSSSSANLNNIVSGVLNGESLTAELSGLAVGTTYYYRAYVVAGGNTINGDMMSFTTTSSLTKNNTGHFIPDGPNCTEQCYTSTLSFSNFGNGEYVTNADDIKYIRLNIEHSFIGDLHIEVLCPNGQSALILQDYYSNDNASQLYNGNAIDEYIYNWPNKDTVWRIGPSEDTYYESQHILPLSYYSEERNGQYEDNGTIYYQISFETESEANYFINNYLQYYYQGYSFGTYQISDFYIITYFENSETYILWLDRTTTTNYSSAYKFSSQQAAQDFLDNVYEGNGVVLIDLISGAYSRVFFGAPDLFDVMGDGTNACDEHDEYNLSGVGYDYAWTSSSQYSTNGYVYDFANTAAPATSYTNGTIQSSSGKGRYILQSNVETGSQMYQPYESFNNFIGCPINGTWTITVCDSWANDNGYLFDWKIKFLNEPISEPTGTHNNHGYVDLGLPTGTMWATMNLGATDTEDYGNRYSWGETAAKEANESDWSNYNYCESSSNTLTKYCNNTSYGYNGFTDELTVLESTDDAATANWGGDWRMPTNEEYQELVNNCDTTWTTINGVRGILFTGRSNGNNSIFLPIDTESSSGTYYWSSSLVSNDPSQAKSLYLYHGDAGSDPDVWIGSDYRMTAYAVRPVYAPQTATNQTGSFTDLRDGQTYATITIGDQTWMSENLRYEGDIPLGNSNLSSTDPQRSYPSSMQSTVTKYGYLYNWLAVMNGESSSNTNPSEVQGICPSGWHLPSDLEWTHLTDYLGGDEYAGAMLAGDADAWLNEGQIVSSEYFGTSGFNALPAGGNYGGNDGFYDETFFWTATENSSSEAYYRHIDKYGLNISRSYDNKNGEYSVRCVKNAENTANSDIPFSCDFEDTDENANWTLANGTQTNQWHIGTAASHGGDNGLYISNDDGTSNAYTLNTTSYVYAYRNLNIAEDGVYMVSFDWLGQGESNYDLLRAFITPTSAVLEAGSANGMTSSNNTTPNGWTDIANPEGKLNNTSEWQQSEKETYLEAGTYNLVFFWKNDNSGGSQPPAAIDNLSITKVSCPSVADITVSEITTESASISWTERGSAGNWEIIVSNTALDETQLESYADVETATSTTYSATGLSPATTYYVYVRAACSADEKSLWTSTSFTSGQNHVSLPYTCDFENADENQNWALINGDQTNKWYIGAAASNGGSNGLYVTNDLGTSNAYTTNATSYVYAYRTIEFSESDTYNISFDWKANGQSNYDLLRAFIVPTSAALEAGNANGMSSYTITTPNGWIDVANPEGQLNLATEWQQSAKETHLEAGTYNLVFFWKNNNTSGSQPPAAIDNLNIKKVTCLSVTNIRTSSITTSSAYINWHESADASTWEVIVSDTELSATALENYTDATVLYDSSYNATGLNPGTKYYAYIRAVCSDSDKSLWQNKTFKTNCNTITVSAENPYSEDFNSYSGYTTGTTAPTEYPSHTMPHCWEFVNMSETTSTYPQIFLTSSSTYAVSGNCLFFKSNSTIPAYAVLPTFSNSIENLSLEFTYKNEGVSTSNGTLHVGISNDISDLDASYVDIKSFEQTTTQTTEVVNFATETALTGEYYIVFKYVGGNTNNYYMSIDDVSVRFLSSDAEITAFTFAEDAEIANINSDAATITSVVSYSTASLDGLVPTITVSSGASVSPESGVAQDFTSPVTYTVTAENGGTTKEWTVSVSKAAGASSANNILSFTFDGQLGESVIDADSHTVSAYAEWYCDISNIIPAITVSPQATISPASGVAQDFTNPVSYTVTAEDVSSQTWTVTVIPDQNACPNPEQITVSNIVEQTATISWQQRYLETSYRVKVSSTEMSDMTATADIYDNVISSTTLDLTGLTRERTYYVYVQSACGNDEGWVSTTFTTIITPATIPYTCDFEEITENNDWKLVNGDQTNKWYIGSATNNGGENGLYISNDNGTSNEYTLNTPSYVYAYRNLNMAVGGYYTVSFDWLAKGESTYDLLRAFILPTSVTLEAGNANGMTSINNTTPDGWTDIANPEGKLNNKSDWQQSSKEIALEAGIYNLVFFWKNDDNGGTQPPAVIDNIEVTRIYPVVETSSATNITNTSATLNGRMLYSDYSEVTTRGFLFGTSSTNLNQDYTSDSDTTVFSYQLTGLSANTQYYYQAYATIDGETKYGEIKTFNVANGQQGSYYYVDLGLPSGTMWATCNVGATSPEDFGNYYAWGETEPKETYDWSTYRYCNGSENTLTKYCSDEVSGNNGFTDGLTTLEASDDVATVNWGEGWRMPTFLDIDELVFKCTFETIEQNGVLGSLVTGPNGNCIFLPAAGTYQNNRFYEEPAYYWSSTTDIFSNYGFVYSFYNEEYESKAYFRQYGNPVRPIYRTAPTTSVSGTQSYYCDFEDEAENFKWIIDTSTTTLENKWYIGAAANNGGNSGLYISKDNGASNVYNGSSRTYTYTYRSFEITENDFYEASFDWRAMGADNEHLLRAFIIPMSQNPYLKQTALSQGNVMPDDNNDAPDGWIDGELGILNMKSEWQHASIQAQLEAGAYYLVFFWKNTSYSSPLYSQPPAAIDNISIHKSTCPFVGDITVSVTDQSAEISWTEQGSAENWEIVVSETPLDNDALNSSENIVPLTTASYSATGLSSLTQYYVYVRAACSTDDKSRWESATLWTDGAEVTTLYPDTRTNNSAMLRAKSLSQSGATDYTFYYGTDRNNMSVIADAAPTMTDSIVTIQLRNLNPETSYYYTVELNNAYGTGRGDTLAFLTCGQITDERDGNQYYTIQIGEQTWLADYLRYEGDIQLGSSSSTTEPYRYYPNNEATNVQTYGYLYNWLAAMNGQNSSEENPSGVQGICPNGWHLPSMSEFRQLEEALTGNTDHYNLDAGAMLSSQAELWGNTALTQSEYFGASGFNALPSTTTTGTNGTQLTTCFWTTEDFNIGDICGRIVEIYASEGMRSDGAGEVISKGNSVRCIKNLPPTVATLYPDTRTNTSATLKAKSFSGNMAGINYTFYYGESPTNMSEITNASPTVNGNVATILLSGLSPETQYYYAAEITSEFGTARGDTLSFITCGSFTDERDGNQYYTTRIGEQTWMAQNLRFAGDIQLATAEEDTSSFVGYRYYPENAENVPTYGYLYNWTAAMNGAASGDETNPSRIQGICPNGWHLPSRPEFLELEEALTGNTDAYNLDAGAMLSGQAELWGNTAMTKSENFGATGFNALPVGQNINGNYYSGDVEFWTTRDFIRDSRCAIIVSILNNQGMRSDGGGHQTYYGLSVRCVKGLLTYAYDTVKYCGESYAYHDTTITASGDYIRHIHTANDLDTTYHLHLTLYPTLTATISYSDGCHGANNGFVEVTATGGSNSYTYLWNTTDQQTSARLENLEAGEYVVNVTDAVGCSVTASQTLTEPEELTASLTAGEIACNGGTTNITNTVEGGTPTYSYSWGGGETSQNLSNVTAGTYNVTVTDANSCTATAAITISEPTLLTLSLSATEIACNGGTASITSSISGGTPTYTYSWSTGVSSQNLTNVTAGNYSVTVTDANLCTATASITISEPALLSASLTATEIACNGGTANITNTVSGGTPTYTYSWTGGATSQNLSGVSAGTYNVTVTDVNSCSATASVTINEPEELTASLSAGEIACNGGNTNISSTVEGGTTPYTYIWSNGSSAQEVSNVTAGTYSVTIRDVNGCSVTTSVSIEQPNVLTTSLSATTIACNGGTSDITNTISGGTEPYTYTWTPSASTQNLTGISAGTYSVTVTDSHECTATSSVEITQPEVLTSVLSAGSVACNGGTASITNAVSGGTTPYTFAWDNGSNTQDLSGVTAGTYAVTVSDNRGCSVTATAEITQPEILTITLNAGTIACNGGTTTISSTVEGGTEPYQYAWSTDATTDNLTNAVAGTYSVTITDANTCSTNAVTTITQPDELSVTISGSTSVCEGTSTRLTANVSGGTSGYTYAWSSGETSEEITTTNITAATPYSVTVSDANSCSATASVSVSVGTTPGVEIVAEPSACFGNNIVLQANVSNAGTNYTLTWSATPADDAGLTTTEGDRITVTPTAEGSYTYTASLTTTSCSDDEPFNSSAETTIAVNPLPDVAITNNTGTTELTCNTETISLTATGGTIYAWSSGATTEQISLTTSGNYSVTVTDANTCSNTASIEITQNVTSPTVSISNTSVTSILTCSLTSINVEASGDGESYQWSGGASPSSAENTLSAEGTYTVTATADNGCTSTASILISEDVTPPTLSITNSTGTTELTCERTSINVGVTSNGVSYQWSDGETPNTASNTLSSAGTYTVTATGENGCTSTADITITQNVDLPNVVATASDSSICLGSSTTLTATGAESYQWSPITNLSISIGNEVVATPTETTTYTVTATAENGCTLTAVVPIVVNTTVENEVAITACESYDWNGTTYTETGDFTQTFIAANGCDSVVTLHLTINNAVTNEISDTACGSYQWNDSTYYASGEYIQTFYTREGCDSIVTLNLTINTPTESNDTVTVCGSYEWNGTTYTESGSYQFTLPNANANGCDSIANLFLTINQPLTESVEITACDSYQWNDSTYYASGDYEQTFIAVNGCDSVVTLHLTINNSTTSEVSAQMCSGVPYTYEGETFTEAGTYEVTLVNANGCDSIVTLTITYANNCSGIVSGIVTDENTDEPIPNARVTVGNKVTRTNAEGEYSLEVLRGRKALRVSAPGFISYSRTVDIQSDTIFNASLKSPRIETDVDSLTVSSYPYLEHSDTITLSNTGSGTLIWSSITEYDNLALVEDSVIQQRSNTRSLWDSIQTFATRENAEQAIATDGFFIYTSSWMRPGEFNRYTPNGEYVETFYVENVGAIRNLSYDGTNFYGTEGTNIIFKLDLDNQTLVDSIETDIQEIRHCSFNRQDGSLLAGSWNSLYRIDIENGTSEQIRNDLANVYSSAFDNLSAGGPYLWLFSQTSQNNGPSACIRQFNISTGEYTNKTHYLDDINLNNTSLAGGICASEYVCEGKFVLLADVQNPSGSNTIATYEIGRTNCVVRTGKKSGTIEPNESERIFVRANATETGDYSATIKYRAAVMGQQSRDVNLNFSAVVPECDAVQQISIATDTFHTVTLDWQPVELGEYESVSYLVFNTASQFAIDTVSGTTVTYDGLPAGNHCFTVCALSQSVYTCLSAASDTVCAEIEPIPCNVTLAFEAANDGESIFLTWNKPVGVEYFRLLRDDNGVEEVLYDEGYIDTNVVPEVTYCYTIFAYFENDICDEIVGTACTKIASGVCAEAPVITAEVFGNSVHLSWTATSDSYTYRIFRDDVAIGMTTDTTYLDNVTYGYNYCYKVESLCDYGMFIYSNEECVFVNEGDAIEEWSEDNLSVYPNPTYGQFFIEGQRIATVIIYNASGQIVAELDNNESDRIMVNCDGWNPGLYNVRIISTEGETATRKVTIFR
jgi:uncharacterized protein (TIGR02145 family)